MAKQRNGPVIDEEFMKEMISQGIPIKRNQASTENVIKEPVLEKKEETQSVSTETKKEDKMQNFDSRPRESKRKRDMEGSYIDTYFDKVDFSDRQLTTITRDTHIKLTHIVKIIGGKNGTIGSYIENIIRKHFETYKDEINTLCEQNLKKPL